MDEWKNILENIISFSMTADKVSWMKRTAAVRKRPKLPLGILVPLLTMLILVQGRRAAWPYSLSKECTDLPRFTRLLFLRKTVNFETNALKLRCRLHNKIKITGYKKEKQDRCSMMVWQNYTYKFPATVSQSPKSWQSVIVFNIGVAGANCIVRWWLRHIWTRLCDPGWHGGCQWSRRFLPIWSYPMI